MSDETGMTAPGDVRRRADGSVETVCQECGYRWTLDAEAIAFYRDRRLALPTRCRWCRSARRAAREPAHGTVVMFNSASGRGILQTDGGERVVVAHFCCQPQDLPLRVGQTVTFEIEDGTPLRRASAVYVVRA